MKLNELSPAAGSTQRRHTARAGAPAPATARPPAAATRARRPAPAAVSASALRAARCLWPAASPSAASTTFSQSPWRSSTSALSNKFEDGDTVTAEALLEKGILSKCEYGYKVLGNGKVTKKVTVTGFCFLRVCQGGDRGSWRKGRGDLSDPDDSQRRGVSPSCARRSFSHS